MKSIQSVRLTSFYDKRDEWYFVEFKDAKVFNIKISVLRKAYPNTYAIMDVLYAMKEENIEHPPFDYGGSIQLSQTHVIYILVPRGASNPYHAMQSKSHRLKREHYLPEFMKRSEGYIYKEAYTITKDVFEHTFLRDFVFQCYLAYLHREH